MYDQAAADRARARDAEVARLIPLECLTFAREQKLGMDQGEEDVLTKDELDGLALNTDLAHKSPRPDSSSLFDKPTTIGVILSPSFVNTSNTPSSS